VRRQRTHVNGYIHVHPNAITQSNAGPRSYSFANSSTNAHANTFVHTCIFINCYTNSNARSHTCSLANRCSNAHADASTQPCISITCCANSNACSHIYSIAYHYTCAFSIYHQYCF